MDEDPVDGHALKSGSCRSARQRDMPDHAKELCAAEVMEWHISLRCTLSAFGTSATSARKAAMSAFDPSRSAVGANSVRRTTCLPIYSLLGGSCRLLAVCGSGRLSRRDLHSDLRVGWIERPQNPSSNVVGCVTSSVSLNTSYGLKERIILWFG
jgi:hypothetical protein